MNHNKSIYVTQTFLPPIEEYYKLLEEAWENGQVTNQGPLLRRLEDDLVKYLKVDNLQIVSNGTIALQIALRSLGITEGEVITTPFSYVATTSAILWERCEPVFVDIDPQTFNIDPKKIEAAITPETKAILAVHVFGNPCDVESIDKIAKKHNLKVIYDAAHAFGVEYQEKSLFSYGDVSICSFHATKLFHTIEGGCLITSDKQAIDNISLIKKFGHFGDDHTILGINAKNSDMHAAMGIANLVHVQKILDSRKNASEKYTTLLNGSFKRQEIASETKYNYSYYPILFESEEKLQVAISRLSNESIFPRRYFYPSLNELSYLGKKIQCPISEDISRRILCLPLYYDMKDEDIERICKTIL